MELPEKKLFPWDVSSSDTSTVSVKIGLRVLENKKIGDSNKTNSIGFFITLKFKINKKVKLLRIGYLIFVLMFITVKESRRLQRKNKSGW